MSFSSSGGLSVSVKGLGKAYNIAQSGTRPTSAAEAIIQRVRNPLKRAQTEEFWALKDVNFEVRPGEVVGLIGRNGAGKSTLLKVLSRITEPTTGSATIYGRVGSLLEVGTGFHPELTGRENIYLNGSILGMRKSEIDTQFDAIVDFSGVERFLDTPVKRYSSGMYVRLAFAVAAHLNPEVLIIDEVLAVGDAAFQKKCLGKMQDVAREGGRTVLFVSHAMNSVLQLCTRGIYLKNGTVFLDAPAAEVVERYVNDGMTSIAEQRWEVADAPGGSEAKILAVRILDESGEVSGNIPLSQSFTIEMEFVVLEPGLQVAPVFHFYNAHNECMFSNGNVQNKVWMDRQYGAGLYRAQCHVPADLLNDGGYYATAIVVRNHDQILAWADRAVNVELQDDGAGRGSFTGTVMGVLRPQFAWSIEQIEERETK